MKNMSKLYNIKELTEGMFPLSFNLVYRCQREDPFLTEKPKCAEYTKGYFCRGRNTIDLIMYKDKIVIRSEMVSHISASSRTVSKKAGGSPAFLLAGH